MNTKKVILISTFVLLGLTSAEEPKKRDEIFVESALRAEKPEYETIALDEKKLACQEASASLEHIDAARIVSVPHTTLMFEQKPLSLTYKKFSTAKGHDAILVGYEVPENDILFSQQQSHIKSIQNHIDGAEKLVVYEGPKKDGKFYSSTVVLFKQDWDRFGLSLAGQAAKRAFYEHMSRKARDLVENPEKRAENFIERLSLRIPRGIRFMVISHPACPHEMFPVSLKEVEEVVKFNSRPETKVFRIQNIFGKDGEYGVYYELGHNLKLYPNMEKFRDRSTWDSVPKFTGYNGKKHFTVYFKIKGLSIPSEDTLRRITREIIASYDQAAAIHSRWTFFLATETGLPADWFDHLSVLTKKVKILIVPNQEVSNKDQ